MERKSLFQRKAEKRVEKCVLDQVTLQGKSMHH